MPRIGSARSRRMSSAKASRAAPVVAVALLIISAGPAPSRDAVAGLIVGDGIPLSLTGAPGDPVHGRAIVIDRTRGLCLLCHSGPFPDQPFQGNLAPDLAGSGSRYTMAQLRLRIADGRVLNPDTIMPSYGRVEGLNRVAPTLQGRPILQPGEIEDVVAFLATLRQERAE
jgi:sulfur-oxidizing protein SoxX